MLRKVKKILIMVLALMFILLAIISYFAYIKYNDERKELLKQEIQDKISLGIPSEIPEENKKIEFISTEDGISVFNEIVFDGLTMDELTKKLDKSLTSNLTGTGKLFAEKSIEYGVDPYLMVSISLLETGCKWGCSYLTRECNNVGGMKGTPNCPGTTFRSFPTLEEGIDAFIANLYKNYYGKGLDTAEKIEKKYANGSNTWAKKVNNYMKQVKEK